MLQRVNLKNRQGLAWEVVRVFPLFFVLALAILIRFLFLDADIPLAQNADDLGDEGYWWDPVLRTLPIRSPEYGTNFFQGLLGGPLSVFTLRLLTHLTDHIGYIAPRSISAFYSSALLLLGVFYFFRLRKQIFAGWLFLLSFGLFPLGVFYGRIYHLEHHLLFYVFLSAVIAEYSKSKAGYLLSGVVISIAIWIKLIAALYYVPILLFLFFKHRKQSFVPLFYFVIGSFPGLIGYLLYFDFHSELFFPTLRVLGSYHGGRGFFLDAFSLHYFWLRPMGFPFFVLALCWYLALVFNRKSLEATHWSFLSILWLLVFLSLWRYQTIARHQLLVFPLIIALCISIDKTLQGLQGMLVRRSLASLLTLFCVYEVLFKTLPMGFSTFLVPHYTLKEASQTLGAMTNSEDRVVGANAHLLAIEATYLPRMRIEVPQWADIDPLTSGYPSVLLQPRRYNNVRGTFPLFGLASSYPFAEKIGSISYLERFETDVYRVFQEQSERDTFLRFRSGRASRYDGLLYNLFKDRIELGCRVKALLVAESRGDPEISHKKISTTGCAGMFGFCYGTAKEFPHYFTQLVSGLSKKVDSFQDYELDDRFNAERSALAAAEYISSLEAHFRKKNYSEATQFSFASYNGGAGFVQSLIRMSEKDDPSWESDILPLLLKEDTSRYLLYGRWSKADRDHKLRVELPLYVKDTMETFEECSAR